MKNIMKRRNKKGFTIVELVIVIGVIGILSAILIPTFVGVTNNAKRARTQANLANAYSAYAAEAADGVVDEDTSTPKATIEFVSQEKVALAADGKYFTYSNGWVVKEKTEAEAKTALGGDLTPVTSYSITFGGYTVYYHKVA